MSHRDTPGPVLFSAVCGIALAVQRWRKWHRAALSNGGGDETDFLLIDRRRHFAVKWDLRVPLFGAGADVCTPMWVADMDLPICSKIQAAVIKRAQVNSI